jgi:hydroxylaminobenzene mutase
MGLSAHLEGVMNGIFLLALGGAWNEVRLPHPIKVTAYCTALYGTYVNWLVTSVTAAFGTAANSPITSAGHSGQPRQESFVAMGFLTVAVAIIATSILVLWGLRGTAAEVNDSWKHSEFDIPRERRKDADHEPGDRAALDAQSSGGTPLVLHSRRRRLRTRRR